MVSRRGWCEKEDGLQKMRMVSKRRGLCPDEDDVQKKRMVSR